MDIEARIYSVREMLIRISINKMELGINVEARQNKRKLVEVNHSFWKMVYIQEEIWDYVVK